MSAVVLLCSRARQPPKSHASSAQKHSLSSYVTWQLVGSVDVAPMDVEI